MKVITPKITLPEEVSTYKKKDTIIIQVIQDYNFVSVVSILSENYVLAFGYHSVGVDRNKNVIFVRPPFIKEGSSGYLDWEQAMRSSERTYKSLVDKGYQASYARTILSRNAAIRFDLAAEMKEWKKIFQNVPMISIYKYEKEFLYQILEQFQAKIPDYFDDIDPWNS